jgi:glycosyltransferase involved in cell wall biosynthesis
VPSELLGLDDGTTSAALASWIGTQPAYDLVWFNRPISYLATSAAVSAPSLVDLDDLEDRKLTARLVAEIDETGTWGGPRLPGWRTLARHKARRNAQGWRALQIRIARETQGAVLASADGAAESALDTPEVVPNCYPMVSATDRVASDVPTFLLVGLMTYRPNADGASWFVREVWPMIRRSLPGAQLRIVGAASGAVLALADEPDVTVTGSLPSLDPELQHADVAVVPIRFGGGTRVKVLESWAHGIPVVSTTTGAAGLGARDGEHLLIADDARSFAHACERAADDLELRARVVDGGRRLHAERYTCDRVEAVIADLARRTCR